MKEISDKEEKWLINAATVNSFFESLLQFYRNHGYLSDTQYYWLNLFIKNELDGNQRTSDSINLGHKIVKIPCPHCNHLCSYQVKFCLKCGEPLPRVENIETSLSKFDIIDENYTERTILHSIEKEINKAIPLYDKFNSNTTCYVKENNEITGISLFKCNLDFIPREILKFKSLKYLALRRNNITILPKNFGFLSNLEYLDLRINKLEKLPKSIGLLSNLKILNLSSNNLKGIPNTIGDLKSLKELNLNNNKLKNLPESLWNLNSLEKLSLRANFWIEIPDSIKKLKKQDLQILI